MALKFLAGNKITGLSTDSKPDSFSTDIVGVTFFETNTQDLYLWDGDSWELVVGNAVAENDSTSFHFARIKWFRQAAKRHAKRAFSRK